MILIDANLLIYAYDSSSSRHERARSWFEMVMSSPVQIRLDWITLLAFVRITTHGRILENPFLPWEALEIVEEWLQQPNVQVLQPGSRFLDLLQQTVESSQAKGPLVMDAALATLAMEHGATLCTHDRDFARFSGLRRHDPLSQDEPAGWVHEI